MILIDRYLLLNKNVSEISELDNVSASVAVQFDCNNHFGVVHMLDHVSCSTWSRVSVPVPCCTSINMFVYISKMMHLDTYWHPKLDRPYVRWFVSDMSIRSCDTKPS